MGILRRFTDLVYVAGCNAEPTINGYPWAGTLINTASGAVISSHRIKIAFGGLLLVTNTLAHAEIGGVYINKSGVSMKFTGVIDNFEKYPGSVCYGYVGISPAPMENPFIGKVWVINVRLNDGTTWYNKHHEKDEKNAIKWIRKHAR